MGIKEPAMMKWRTEHQKFPSIACWTHSGAALLSLLGIAYARPTPIL